MNQKSHSFIWHIYDDGSKDGTDKYVFEISKISLFKIEYFSHKTNVGKHKIINKFASNVKTKLLFIVDSDDQLSPDAVEIIRNDWNLYALKGLIGLTYLKANFEKKIVGMKFPNDKSITSYHDMRIIRGIKGDKAEIWLTSIFNSIDFHEFKDEKFISEQHKYIHISKEGVFFYRNQIIYFCDYKYDGLSRNIRKLQLNNPKGVIVNALTMFESNPTFLIKIKNIVQIGSFRWLLKKEPTDIKIRFKLMLFSSILAPFSLAYLIYLLLTNKDSIR